MANTERPDQSANYARKETDRRKDEKELVVMDIDTVKIRELLDKRDEIDNQLAAAFLGGKRAKTTTM